MTSTGYSRGQRNFILWVARLTVLIYVFQIGAVDHWHVDPGNVTGLEGSQLHAAHCHSDTAQCADSSGLIGTLADVGLMPLFAKASMQAVLVAFLQPPEAWLSSPDQPPQSI